MDKFLRLENRHTGEILRIRRVHDARGRIVLILEGTLPPRASGPPLHVHTQEREEGIVKAGTLRGRALVHRLWTLTPRAALLTVLLFNKNHSEVGC